MLEVDGDDDAALLSTESCRRRLLMVAVFHLFFGDFFVHSTGILCRIGTKHEILGQKSRENPLEKTFNCCQFRSIT
jgi:hypothetical protein